MFTFIYERSKKFLHLIDRNQLIYFRNWSTKKFLWLPVWRQAPRTENGIHVSKKWYIWLFIFRSCPFSPFDYSRVPRRLASWFCQFCGQSALFACIFSLVCLADLLTRAHYSQRLIDPSTCGRVDYLRLKSKERKPKYVPQSTMLIRLSIAIQRRLKLRNQLIDSWIVRWMIIPAEP